eukprot:TRINITY_DN8292_c0_g1_i1.p1 TRINITY_DN8292_c0_g1~~TRINITY_DN8292_c0_g1_i1.p1  ORF type:complete len:112 (-),score=22.43 TRINITY_DN8292_c0_g1_i1:35-370(-)
MSVLNEAFVDHFNQNVSDPKLSHPGSFLFAGVDFIMDEKMNPYLIEVTTGPGFSNIYCDKFNYLQPMMDELFDIVYETKKRVNNNQNVEDIKEVISTDWKRIARYPQLEKK